MLKKTIGVFDSGMGGLTAVQELERLLPDADIVYFGDTGHIPYGGRSRSQLMYMARRNIAFLEERGAGIILAACGTVTSTVLDTLAAETATPLFGVARPAAVRAAGLTKNGVIGFIATEACIASGYNQRLISELLPGAEIVSSACPDFVPLIESGVCSWDDARLRSAIERYLSGIKAAGADVVVLGVHPLSDNRRGDKRISRGQGRACELLGRGRPCPGRGHTRLPPAAGGANITPAATQGFSSARRKNFSAGRRAAPSCPSSRMI